MIWVLIGIIFLIFAAKPWEVKLPLFNAEMINEHISGKVSKKYIEKHNHAAKVIELEHQDAKINLLHFMEYYNQINIGDNVLKNRNDSIFYIIKPDTTFCFIYQI